MVGLKFSLKVNAATAKGTESSAAPSESAFCSHGEEMEGPSCSEPVP